MKRYQPFSSFALLLALGWYAARPSPARADDVEQAAGAKRVTEVRIERTPCNGRCPVYTTVIAADGTIRYTGEMHVPRQGVHTGKVAKEKFDELVKFILDSGFMGLMDNYATPPRKRKSSSCIGGRLSSVPTARRSTFRGADFWRRKGEGGEKLIPGLFARIAQ